MNPTTPATEAGPVPTIQRRTRAAGVPDDDFVRSVIAHALPGRPQAMVNVRIVDLDEGRELNRRWRDRDHATNVLSFPASLPEDAGLDVLGDIVLCAPVIGREAEAQGKSLQAHWAHLLIHGMLHLQGFDHVDAGQARVMERREVALLRTLGYPDPYRETA